MHAYTFLHIQHAFLSCSLFGRLSLCFSLCLHLPFIVWLPLSRFVMALYLYRLSFPLCRESRADAVAPTCTPGNRAALLQDSLVGSDAEAADGKCSGGSPRGACVQQNGSCPPLAVRDVASFLLRPSGATMGSPRTVENNTHEHDRGSGLAPSLSAQSPTLSQPDAIGLHDKLAIGSNGDDAVPELVLLPSCPRSPQQSPECPVVVGHFTDVLLLHSISEGDIDAVKEFLNSGVDINAKLGYVCS